MSDTHDDELRIRLSAADPAATLPQADPDLVARLLEDVMSTELTTESRESGTRDRSPLTWLVAAAAVLIIAGAGVFLLSHRGPDPVTPPTAGHGTTVTQLAAPAPAAYTAKCMVPNADALGTQTLAVDATVTTLSDGLVTLTPTHWYAGDPTDLVRVQAPSADLQALVGAVKFADGGRYLISATDGQVTVCGFSAPYSDELAALYAEAFPS